MECLILRGTDGVLAGLIPHAGKVPHVAAAVLLVAALLAIVLVGAVGVPSADTATTGEVLVVLKGQGVLSEGLEMGSQEYLRERRDLR